jgi:hypothetical protein
MEDSVAVDAKRILLRYGVPIAILDQIEVPERIELAREVSRTEVPERGDRLTDLLVERGYLEAEAVAAARSSRRKRRRKRS